MKTPHIGDTVLTSAGERMVTAVDDMGLVSIVVDGATLDFYPGELFWVDSHQCWQEKADSGASRPVPRPVPRPVGRPLLANGEETLRAGFMVTKWQWLAVTARARSDGVSFSEVVRRALDAYLKE